MSYSTVYGLWPGEEKRVRLAEFRNSWGMAPVVWDALAQRHLGARPHAWSATSDALWKLHTHPDVPLAARAVLRMTFDHCYIRAEDVRQAIDDIAIFLYAYRDVIPEGANHWSTYASTLVTFKDSVPAFGVHQTSVSENTWEGPYDEATDARLPFDWSQASSVYPLPGVDGGEPTITPELTKPATPESSSASVRAEGEPGKAPERQEER